MAFEAQVRKSGAVAVVDLRGDIDSDADQALGDAYAQAVSDGGGTLLLNFDAVSYINSSGIALIVGVLARAKAQGVTLRACGLSDHYREIFEITRLVDFVHIFEDETAALGAAT